MLTEEEKQKAKQFFKIVERVPQVKNWGRDIAIIIASDELRLFETISELGVKKSTGEWFFSDILDFCDKPYDEICDHFKSRHSGKGALDFVFIRLRARVSLGFQKFLRKVTTNKLDEWEIPGHVRIVIITTDKEFESLNVEGSFWELGSDPVGKALGPWLRIEGIKEPWIHIKIEEPKEWHRRIIERDGKLYLELGWWRGFQIPDSFSKYLSTVPVVTEGDIKAYKLDVIEFFAKTISYEDIVQFLKIQKKHEWTEEHYALFFSALFNEVVSQRLFSNDQISEIRKILTDIIETGIRVYFEEGVRKGTFYGSYEPKIEVCYKILNEAIARAGREQ